MIKSKIPLLCNVLFLISIVYSFYVIHQKVYKTKYNLETRVVVGYISNIVYTKDNVNFYIDDILVSYKGKDTLELGDKVLVTGKISLPSKGGNFNLFNYRNYLLSKNIHFTFKADNVKVIEKNHNLLYKIKNKLKGKIEKNKNKDYLYTFILGDSNYLNTEVKESYQINGISHLFAVSGMHVSLLTVILLFIMNKVCKNRKLINMVLIVFLLIYIFMTNFSPSVIRASFLFILCLINKELKIGINNSVIIIFLFSVCLLLNPYNLYNTGFLFSYVISYFLIKFGQIINNYHNYFIKLFITSIISFIGGIPIMINNYFSINVLTPFLNLIFVPLVSMIIFPLSLICLLFDRLSFILNFFISIMENLSLFFARYKLMIIFKDVPLVIYLLYLIIIYFVFYKVMKKQYKYSVIFVLILFIHHNINYFNGYYKIHAINVDQGDTFLLELPHNKNVLIDCANKEGFKTEYKIGKNIIFPYLKSQGIVKIDYLILTHGDYDHMGDAINLVNNFKVENVIFNCGEFNDLEKELISVLDKKKIKYYSCLKELNIDNNKLYFLNNNDYGNENDNSIVLYTELNNHKFLFMGDASVKTEKDIMNKYNLKDIDVIKVGHHGSKTSSSEEFINMINPKYSIISVGKNNRYGHPNNEVLEILDKSKIYRTDIDGSIMFKFKNNKFDISTCPP